LEIERKKKEEFDKEVEMKRQKELMEKLKLEEEKQKVEEEIRRVEEEKKRIVEEKKKKLEEEENEKKRIIEEKIRKLPSAEQNKLTIEKQNKLLKEKEIEKIEFIKEKIKNIYISNHHKSYLNIIENAVSAIKSGKLALEIGYKFQDIGYGSALGNNSVTSCELPYMFLHNKISHLDIPFYGDTARFVNKKNKEVEKRVPISSIARTASLSNGQKYVISTVPERRESMTETVKIPKKEKLTYGKIMNFFKKKNNKVDPNSNFSSL
jgi:hypothetical protein